MAALVPRPFVAPLLNNRVLNQVHPRNRNKINSTGIGTPISHKNIQPAFPASPALSHIVFICERSFGFNAWTTGYAHEKRRRTTLNSKFRSPDLPRHQTMEQ
jgi:hypothetical protein